MCVWWVCRWLYESYTSVCLSRPTYAVILHLPHLGDPFLIHIISFSNHKQHLQFHLIPAVILEWVIPLKKIFLKVAFLFRHYRVVECVLIFLCVCVHASVCAYLLIFQFFPLRQFVSCKPLWETVLVAVQWGWLADLLQLTDFRISVGL